LAVDTVLIRSSIKNRTWFVIHTKPQPLRRLSHLSQWIWLWNVFWRGYVGLYKQESDQVLSRRLCRLFLV